MTLGGRPGLAIVAACCIVLASCGSERISVTKPDLVDSEAADEIVGSFLSYSYATLGSDYGTGFALLSQDCHPPVTLEKFSVRHSRNNDLVDVFFGVDSSTIRYSSVEILSVVDGRAEVTGQAINPALREAADTLVLVEENGSWLVQACGIATAPIPPELNLG